MTEAHDPITMPKFTYYALKILIGRLTVYISSYFVPESIEFSSVTIELWEKLHCVDLNDLI